MNAAHLEVTFSSWLGTFLAARDLKAPSGVLLYEYHVTDEELVELRRYLAEASRCQDPGDSRSFAAAWFLYAAEWWKRSYSGGAWGWSGVFGSVPIDEPDTLTRQTWVLRAKTYWKIPGALPVARPYLGLVILNAGIPSKLIEESHGKIAALFRLVFRRIGKGEQSHCDILEAVREQQSLLPQTYREESIFSLVASVVESVLRLRQEYRLTESVDPLAKLEQVCPLWQRRFPLGLNAPAANRLLKGLLKDAVAAASARPPFLIRRSLRREPEGKVSPVCLIDCANSLTLDQLESALGLEQGKIPQSFELSARANNTVVAAGRGIRRGGEVLFRIDRTRLPDDWFTRSIVLEISQYGRLLHSVEVVGSDAPDPDSPWVFNDTEPIAELVRTGGGRLRSGALLCVPQRARLAGAAVPPEIGRWGERRLFLLGEGAVTIVIDHDVYCVSCGKPEAAEHALMWRGRRLQLESSPLPVFVSRPRLVRIAQDGHQSNVHPSDLYWRPLGAPKDISLDGAFLPAGVGYLTWRDQGSIQTRLRAVCLPESASVELEAGASSGVGKIRLRNWPAQNVLLAGPEGVDALVSSRAAGCWDIEARSDDPRVPVNLSLQVNWPGQGIQTIRVPYPAEGALITDQEGKVIETGASLRIDDLLGARAQLQSTAIRARWHMVIALRGAGGAIVDRTMSYHSGDSTIVVVRLFELIPVIGDMLSSVEGLDVEVDIRFELRGRRYPGIRITRYACELVPNHDVGICSAARKRGVAGETQHDQHLLALPLQSPKREIELPLAPGHWPTPTWLFSPQMRMPGNWIIYSEAGAKDQLRPLGWTVAADERSSYPSVLKSAVGLARSCDRIDALAAGLRTIADAPDHHDWWWIEQLVEKVGHLPLPSLDLWVALIRVPAAVVMAHLRVDGFASRISPRLRDELPFEWSFTSPTHWSRAVTAMCRWCAARKEEDERIRSTALFDMRLARAPSLSPLLGMAAGFATAARQGRRLPELDFEPPQLQQMKQFLLGCLIDGDSSPLQGHLRRLTETDHANWPKELHAEALELASTPEGGRLLKRMNQSPSDPTVSTILAPFLLAQAVARGNDHFWRGAPNRVAALRNYRNFDPHWFDEAYQHAMQCSLCDGNFVIES